MIENVLKEKKCYQRKPVCTILEIIKVGVKIECQEAKSQEQIEACKTPEASNHFSDKMELKKVK